MAATNIAFHFTGISPLHPRTSTASFHPWGKRLVANGSLGKNLKVAAERDGQRLSVGDYFTQAKELISSGGGDGPPRWFSPLECGSRMDKSPLLLYLPGIDGVGLGLILQHQKLGEIFDVWCLHIPVKDRTPFEGLVLLVEEIVRSESHRFPDRPIYLVGESIGGCIALSVAAQNPDVDFMLILANPATCYNRSQLQALSPLLEVIPSDLSLTSLPYTLSLITGELLKMTLANVEKGLELQDSLEPLLGDIQKLSSYPSVLADILPKDTLLWKLQMMKLADSFVNSHLHAVKAQTLILASGKDPLLPSLEEAERIRGALPKQEIRVFKDSGEMPKCEIRRFNNSGHFLFLEDDVDLVTTIKNTSFYRQAKNLDYVSDYLPPTQSEFKKLLANYRWIDIATDPVMLSTLENGKIVRGLAGIPQEGPVLLVGNHILLGMEVFPLVLGFLAKENIRLRGLAHPMAFVKLHEDPALDISPFDGFRILGAVPVSGSNFYKLLSSGSHVLLYPGGVREALHRRGETYQLFWPERSEFVRMAAKFGAKIIPFATVGEDDVFEIIADYDDQRKMRFLMPMIERLRNNDIPIRADSEGEVANQSLHFPAVLPKLPGRLYFLFGKPIDTAGMEQELGNKEKAHEMYLHVKSEIERCISYLREKRENDPHRSIVARTLYQATHGFTSEVPTFEL